MTRISRADAARNRQHVVTVARAAFVDGGLELPVREIAQRAGLGVATVYRHFPTRPELVAAVLAEHVAACRADMRAALTDPDAWHGAIRAEVTTADVRAGLAAIASLSALRPEGAASSAPRLVKLLLAGVAA